MSDRLGWHGWFLLGSLLAALPATAQGPIVLDGTLGPAGDVPFLEFGNPSNPHFDYRIGDDLGRYNLLGGNLFHSFSRFDVPAGDIATFSATAGPDNVIVRVTQMDAMGNGPGSDIDGSIRFDESLGDANLFFINPWGITFGPESSLDVSGSVTAGSADVMRFEEGNFSALAPAGEASVLELAGPPSIFGFTGPQPGDLNLERTRGFGVEPGQTLTLVGGKVFVQAQEGSGEGIRAPGASVQIASARPGAEIPVGDLRDLDAETAFSEPLDTVELTEALIDLDSAPGVGPGRLVIRAGNFVMVDSTIRARNNELVPAVGDIDVAATGADPAFPAVLVVGSSAIVTSAGAGDAGGVSLRGPEIAFSGGGIDTFSTGTGMPGDVLIDGGVVTLEGGALVRSLAGGETDGGSLRVVAESLELSGGSRINANAFGDAGAGDVGVEAGRVFVSNEAGAVGGTSIGTESTGAAPGGDLTIDVGTLEVVAGGEIFTSTGGSAPAGRLEVKNAQLVRIADSGAIFTRALGSATATVASELRIGTQVLELSNNALLSSSTSGTAPGGSLTVVATERVSVEGGENASLISAQALGGNAQQRGGDGGAVAIETSLLEVRDGGQITASTTGTGHAGSVTIDADRVRVSGSIGDGLVPSGIFSQSLTAGQLGGMRKGGDGGALQITAREEILVSDRGRISTRTTGSGNAGDVVLEATHGRIELTSGGLVSTATESASNAEINGPGAGGTLELVARDGIRVAGARVESETRGTGNAGDITLHAWRGDVAIVSGARVSAVSELEQANPAAPAGGVAGDIEIISADRFDAGAAEIATRAASSSGGRIRIASLGVASLADADVVTSVREGAGGGGDVTISGGQVVINASRVLAQADRGPGGNILIEGAAILESGDSLVDASSNLGRDGDVVIRGPASDLVADLAVLPENTLDASAELAGACAARTGARGSFAVRRRNPLPAPPDAILPADLGARPEPEAGCALEETTP